MAAIQKLGLGLFVLAVCLFATGEAIWCYRCNDTSCADGAFDKAKHTPVNCLLQAPPELHVQNPGTLNFSPNNKCSKVIKKVNNQQVTVRDCFFKYPTDTDDSNCMKKFSPTSTEFVKCEVCDKDYCNSSPSYYTAAFGLTCLMSLISLLISN